MDTLLVMMGKERSNINLLRHQLSRRSNNLEDKPFILLQIIQHLPMINGNQSLKCVLIEDSKGLLDGLSKDTIRHFIYVISVPEVSCTINTSQKPILKVYQPWTILNSDKLVLHITRFSTIASTEKNLSRITPKDGCNEDLKITHEFHCPCMDENAVSHKCKSKYRDTASNMVDIVLNYK